MKRKSLGFVMSPYEEMENLKELVAMLNDESGPETTWQGKHYGPDDAVKLRRMVRAWQASVRASKNSGTDIQKIELTARDRLDLERFAKGIQVYFERNGTMKLVDYYPSPYDEAAIQFTRLLRNSQGWRLDGPCLKCDKWFLKRTKRANKFCSRRCGGNVRQAMRRAGRDKKQRQRAQQAIANYENLPPQSRYRALGLKSYVAQAAGVTDKWITRAVNRAALVLPESLT